jgi:hypothetical protein
MKASPFSLQSIAYSGCFALVAEYRLTGCQRERPVAPLPIVGLLGHYYPDHWGWLCHDFEAWHKSLSHPSLGKGYLLTRAYVLHQPRGENPKAQVDEKKFTDIVLDRSLVTFKIYTGKDLDLRYIVPIRRFYLGSPPEIEGNFWLG